MARIPTIVLLPLVVGACNVDQTADAIHQELKTEERVAFEQTLEIEMATIGDRIADLKAELDGNDARIPAELLQDLAEAEERYIELTDDWLMVEDATNPEGWALMAESLRKDVDDLEYEVDQVGGAMTLAMAVQ